MPDAVCHRPCVKLDRRGIFVTVSELLVSRKLGVVSSVIAVSPDVLLAVDGAEERAKHLDGIAAVIQKQILIYISRSPADRRGGSTGRAGCSQRSFGPQWSLQP